MYYVLKYIHENIKERLSAEETARQFGYSKWHFTRKFYEYAGMTFVEYVRHYRIQIAALEILSGKKITEVAFDYGYDTIGGFNKAFLKEYGCLPREYVKQTKESQGYYERRKLSMTKIMPAQQYRKSRWSGGVSRDSLAVSQPYLLRFYIPHRALC